MSRISVAMCTYNGERFLPEQLVSIAEQTVQPYELVVCDDGSNDSTVDLIEAFSRNVAFPVRLIRNVEFPVRLIRNPVRLGSTQNFAKCIGLCTGDLIALADQDDHWEIDKLERIGGIFDADPAVTCVFSNGMLMDGNTE